MPNSENQRNFRFVKEECFICEQETTFRQGAWLQVPFESPHLYSECTQCGNDEELSMYYMGDSLFPDNKIDGIETKEIDGIDATEIKVINVKRDRFKQEVELWEYKGYKDVVNVKFSDSGDFMRLMVRNYEDQHTVYAIMMRCVMI